MNKIGLHTNYWTGTAIGSNIYSMLEMTAKAGADVFEISTGLIQNMSKQERHDLKQAIEAKGLQASINGGASPKHDMASADQAFRRESIETYKRTTEIIAEVGAPVWSGVIYSRWLRLPDSVLSYEQKRAAWELALDSIGQLVKTLEDFNVLCCFEIVNRYEQFVLNTSKEGVEFTNQVGSPFAKLLLDTFHMNIEEDNIADAIRHAVENNQMGHLHLGESNRRLPGLGRSNMNWQEIFESVKQSGYQGFLTLEPLVLMGTPLASKVNVWRDMVSDISMDALFNDAKQSISFVRNSLK